MADTCVGQLVVDSVKVATSGDADGDVWGAVKQVGSVAGLPPGFLGRDVARLARCPATIVWRFTLAVVLRVTVAVVVIGFTWAVVLRVTVAVVVIGVAVADFRGRFVVMAGFLWLFFSLFGSCCWGSLRGLGRATGTVFGRALPPIVFIDDGVSAMVVINSS